MKNIARLCVIFFCVIGCDRLCSSEVQSFFLPRDDGTCLDGYFLAPGTASSPIVLAIQGSSCESTLQWSYTLADQVRSLGLGLIVLEKQGISQAGVDAFMYNQNNSLQNRYADYALCLQNILALSPGWMGKIVFLGESEGGMLAAKLATDCEDTAALLLFATGGGMTPREEVLSAIEKRLKEQGASQKESDKYMLSLNEQMDAMLYDPSPNKQFFGNSYKWWASLLNAGEVSTLLCQLSCPIYLVHGTQDFNIPVSSADCLAQLLEQNQKPLTYLRLEGYGHDLEQAEILCAARQWLASVLFGQEVVCSHENFRSVQTVSTFTSNWEMDVSQYVFSRGGRVDVKGGRDSDGNQHASGGVTVYKETEGGGQIEGKIEVETRQDNKGNTKTGVEASLGWKWDCR